MYPLFVPYLFLRIQSKTPLWFLAQTLFLLWTTDGLNDISELLLFLLDEKTSLNISKSVSQLFDLPSNALRRKWLCVANLVNQSFLSFSAIWHGYSNSAIEEKLQLSSYSIREQSLAELFQSPIHHITSWCQERLMSCYSCKKPKICLPTYVKGKMACQR